MEELPREARDSEPALPGTHRTDQHAELIGGPLDGLVLDLSGDAAELREGAFRFTEPSPEGALFAPGASAVYRPRCGDPRRWDWERSAPGA